MVTIIIVIHKTDPNKLKYILNKIKDHHKIIFVVNSENYDFKDISLKKNYQIINSENKGNGAAINLAFSQVNTDYAIYLDTDVIIENDFIEKFIYFSKKLNNFGILVPNHGDLDDKNHFTEKYEGEASIMFFNVKNFKKVGFFDESFFLYFEEVDLMKRCKKEQIKVLFLNNLKIKHIRASSIHNEDQKMKNLRSWHYMWSMFYYEKKHYGYFRAFNKTYKLLIFDVLKIFWFSITLNKKDLVNRYFRLYGLVSALLLKRSFYRLR